MTTITISDEGTRSAVESALWSYASDVEGVEGLWETLWRASGEAAEGHRGAGSEADKTLGMVARARSSIDDVRSCDLGGTVVITVSEKELAKGLDSCKYLIQNNEEFWTRSDGERVRMLAILDVADRLLAELAPDGVVA